MQALCETLVLNNLHKNNVAINGVSKFSLSKSHSMDDLQRLPLDSPPYVDITNEQPLNLSLNSRHTVSADSDCLSQHSSYSTNETHPPRTLIEQLLDNDRLEDLINLKHLDPDDNSDPAQKLANIADEIVEKLVDWTRRLPIYNDLPVDVYRQLLTSKWAEIVLLSTAFYVCESYSNEEDISNSMNAFSFVNYKSNIILLCQRLSDSMKRSMPLEYVEEGAGELVKKFTELAYSFKKLNLSQEAYVCLKVVILLYEGNIFFVSF